MYLGFVLKYLTKSIYLEYAAEFSGDNVGLRSFGVPSVNNGLYKIIELMFPAKI